MRKSIAIVLAAFVASLLGVAYAPDMAAALPQAPKAKTGHIGDTLRLRGSDMTLNIVKATVTKKVRLRQAGLFGVHLVVRNVSTFYDEYWESYPDYEEYFPKSVAVFDTKGKKYVAVRKATDENGARLPNQLGKVLLAKGESCDGWIYFALKPDRWAKTFRFRPNYGMGYDTGKWLLK